MKLLRAGVAICGGIVIVRRLVVVKLADPRPSTAGKWDIKCVSLLYIYPHALPHRLRALPCIRAVPLNIPLSCPSPYSLRARAFNSFCNICQRETCVSARCSLFLSVGLFKLQSSSVISLPPGLSSYMPNRISRLPLSLDHTLIHPPSGWRCRLGLNGDFLRVDLSILQSLSLSLALACWALWWKCPSSHFELQTDLDHPCIPILCCSTYRTPFLHHQLYIYI